MGMIDEAFSNVELKEIEEKLKLEKERLRKKLIAEGREKYIKQLMKNHVKPLGLLGAIRNLIIRYLRRNGRITELHEAFVDAIYEHSEVETKRYEKENLFEKFGKDWLKNDQVLNYVLNNVIPEGTKRNAVLFKNLAIGLVRSGIDDNEIENYVDRIISNCPGKNKNEFLGWIKKAKNGKISNYNRFEMNKWIEDINGREN